MKKILSIVGARPQFVKAAAVHRAAQDRCDHLLLHTGQHYDANMSQVFFDEMGIPSPHYQLRCGGQSHGAMTGRMLEGIEAILQEDPPDWVLVYGDTNSTLAGALAGAKLHIPVAHLEAGMRCFNRRQPEELNRVLADHASDLLLTATSVATDNLIKEGFNPRHLIQVGDVMNDACLYYRLKAEKQSPILGALGLEKRGYLLATLHRAENTDSPDRLGEVFQGLAEVSTLCPVILPLHPRTRSRLEEHKELLAQIPPSLRLVEPVGYLDMLQLEANAKGILTDSGGVQKEAYFLGVGCVVLREVTEWVELVERGGHQLVGGNAASIARAARALLSQTPVGAADLFGDGTASQQVVEALLTWA